MPGTIQSVERAAAILRLFRSRSRRLGVAELSSALGLPKATVHGLLRTLRQVGFVDQDAETGKYMLGAGLLHLGAGHPDANELRALTLSGADALAVRSKESVRVGALHGDGVLIVHHVFRPDHSPQVLDVGSIGISGPVERLCAGGEPRPDLVAYVQEAARSVADGRTGWGERGGKANV